MMKSTSKIKAFILLLNIIAFVSFVSCHKDPGGSSTYTGNPPPPPPPPPPLPSGKTIKVSVVEYDTGIPLPGTVVKLRSNYPSMQMIDLTTDHNGISSFISSTGKFSNISAEKSGYWGIQLPGHDYISPVSFYPDSLNSNLASSFYESDSIVIKLFPKYNITMHIRDSSQSLYGNLCSILFSCQGLFNLYGTNYSVNNGQVINLRPGIDTTFQHPAFGNTVNEFSIWASFDDDCFIHDRFYKTRYSINGNSMIVNINY